MTDLSSFLRRPVQVAAIGIAGAAMGHPTAPALTETELGRVEELLDQMTIEEKVGQMMQVTLDAMSAQVASPGTPHKLDEVKARRVVVEYAAGSILNTSNIAMEPAYWREVVGRLQELAVDETRLGVPLVYGIDSVHGANYVYGATIFPHNLTLAATFEPDLARVSAEITAAESRAVGLSWNFSPVCDVARHPAWSRVFETFGEDTYLASEMVAAHVAGQQGDDLASPLAVAATAKHFLGYSDPRTGRDRTPAYIPGHELHGTFLPPFLAAFDAGARTIMINSGEINGIPVHANPGILSELLRGKLGFRGVAVTDWEDIIKLRDLHRVAETEREATRIAVEAGIDMSMTAMTTDFADHLVSLVRDGEVSESRIDESVRRILALKMELGLFESVMPTAEEMADIGSDEYQAVSLDAARRGTVMLKNEDGVLPLKGTEKLLVTGPASDDLLTLHGAWSYSWQGTEAGAYPDSPTILDAVRDRLGAGRVTHVPGSELDRVVDVKAAAEAARDADVVLLCLGELPSTEGVGDISDLAIPAAQAELAAAIAETGTPVVLVLAENRPRLVTEIAEHAKAVLWMGHPGPHGPRALTEILTGDVNPSGKLPFTYPRGANALMAYDHKTSERPSADWQMNGYDPLYPFGHGLSFTSFGYSGLSVEVPEGVPSGDASGWAVEVSVTVSNTGARAGAETALVYVSDHVASITPRVRRLQAFAKADLEPGESREMVFSLPAGAFSVVDNEGRSRVEPGEFTIRVGTEEHTFRLGG